MANGKNGCEYGRMNRFLIEQMKESSKRTHERMDQITVGIIVAIGSIWGIKVMEWLLKK